MELSGIELRYLVNEIRKKVASGYYVSSVYGITKDSVMLKLHHPTEPDVMLMVSSKGIWITKYRFDTIEENDIIDVLRREIVRAKVVDVQQLGSERIVMLKFTFDAVERNLIAEFFAGGNITLCDEMMKIIAVLNPIEVKHRVLRVKAEYRYPPTRAIDVLELKPEHMKTMLSSDLDVARWMGRNIAIGRKYVEHVLKKSGVDLDAKCRELGEEDVNNLYKNAIEVVADVCNGRHEPVIVKENDVAVDASPLPLSVSQSMERVESYMDAVDMVLSSYLKNMGEAIKAGEFAGKSAELERALEEQEKAKSILLERSGAIRRFADEMMALTRTGAHTITDPSLQTLLSQNNVQIHEERGTAVLSIMDEKISLNKNTAIPSIASLLYSRAKELERGTDSIENAKKKIAKDLERLKQLSAVAKKKVKVREQTGKEWFERYRWFVTSEGMFAVGGRDASSNSALIRRHMTENDIVFHAEVHGSPFFILKNAKGDEESSMQEVAQATASFSRAWRDGLLAVDVFWVRPDQIKKAAPSGQYLPKGAFVIEGKRNSVRGLELKLAVGITKLKDRYTLMCGPHESVKRNSLLYVLIAPDGGEVSEVAKKIKAEFVKLAGDLADYAKGLSMDEIIRAIPSGKSRIIHSAKGASVGEGISGIDSQSADRGIQ
jgi:predicted ribosome quality control (RQC) complex YloA/Tae2 family protein